MILLLSDKTDVHYQRIKSVLDKLKVETATLNTALFPSEHGISYTISDVNEGCVVFDIDDRKVRSNEIMSVWNRRTPPAKQTLHSSHLREYVDKESQCFFEALPHILANCFWLSHPSALRIGSLKPNQLRLARGLGLSIPDTYIGNSPTEMAAFANRYEKLALKSVFMPAVAIKNSGEIDTLTFFTKSITRDKILDVATRVQNCPIILQPYVEKEFELRITVVGDDVFACAIHSQVSTKTREDWRRYDLLNTPHEIFALPEEIQSKLLLLVKELGLVFGCIDMIVTPKGEFVFLEINSNGQWLWIEELTHMPIAETIAKLLIERGRHHTRRT